MEPNSQNIIDKIIAQERYYGKKNNPQNVKISILNTNISIEFLIYIDTLSRVLSLNNYVDLDYITVSDNPLEEKKELDKIRVNFNKVININNIDKNIEELLNYLRYKTNCYIINNSLYLDNCQLIDETGNYTEYLKKASYLKDQYNNYDYLIVIDDELDIYKQILLNLSLTNIVGLKLPISKEVKLSENVDQLRIEALSLSYNLEQIETKYQKINKIIKNNQPSGTANYNNLNTTLEKKLIKLLKEYNNIIIEVCNKLDLSPLIDFIEILINCVDQYTNNLNITNKINDEQLHLLEALKIILNNSLDLLGIITI
jgi:hypothetical protein